jgi:hypothetical protein
MRTLISHEKPRGCTTVHYKDTRCHGEEFDIWIRTGILSWLDCYVHTKCLEFMIMPPSIICVVTLQLNNIPEHNTSPR